MVLTGLEEEAAASLLRGVLPALRFLSLAASAAAARSRSFTRFAAARAASPGLMYLGVLGPPGEGDVAARIAAAPAERRDLERDDDADADADADQPPPPV